MHLCLVTLQVVFDIALEAALVTDELLDAAVGPVLVVGKVSLAVEILVAFVTREGPGKKVDQRFFSTTFPSYRRGYPRYPYFIHATHVIRKLVFWYVENRCKR